MMLPHNVPISAEREAQIERLEAWLLETRAGRRRMTTLPDFGRRTEAPAEAPVSDDTPTDFLPALSISVPAAEAPAEAPAEAGDDAPAVSDATLPSAARATNDFSAATLAGALLGDTPSTAASIGALQPSGLKLGVARPVFGQTELPPWMQGTVVIVASHYGDGVLGCGGLIARLAQLEGRARVHVIFVAETGRDPIPPRTRQGKPDGRLRPIRQTDATAALRLLGMPEANLHHLKLPAKPLDRHLPALRAAFSELLGQLRPDVVIAPFRCDRHPQRLLVREEAVRTLAHLRLPAQLLEYFVDFRWPLFGSADIRQFLHERYLLRLDVATTLDHKRAALACLTGSAASLQPQQERPVLPKPFHDFCQPSEMFLHAPAAATLGTIFKRHRWLIRLAV